MRLSDVMECLGVGKPAARSWLEAFGLEPVRADRWGDIWDDAAVLRVMAIAIDARVTVTREVSLKRNGARRISIKRKLERGLQHGQA